MSRDPGIRPQDAGWVLVLAGDGRVLARGHLHLGRVAESGQPARWSGRLDSLHVGAGAELPPGAYSLQIEDSHETHDVELIHVSVSHPEGSWAEVRWLDPEAPSTLRELGGE